MKFLKLRGIVSLDGEIWKPLKGIKKIHTFKTYRVSNKGRIARLCESHEMYVWKLLQQRADKRNFKVVNLNSSKGQVTFFVHRLVALVFKPYGHLETLLLPERNKDLCSYDVYHLNNDNTDNRPENLEWRLPKNRLEVVIKDYTTGEIYNLAAISEASKLTGVNGVTLNHRVKLSPDHKYFNRLISKYAIRSAIYQDKPWPEYTIEQALESKTKYENKNNIIIP